MTLAIGCRFSEVGTGSYGLQPPGKMIHVDVDARVLGRNYPAEVPIISDAGRFVSALLPRLKPTTADTTMRQEIAAGHAAVRAGWQPSEKSERVAPPLLLSTLQTVLGPDAIFTTDSGNGTFLAIECLRLDRPRSFLAPIDYSCMGYAVPRPWARPSPAQIVRWRRWWATERSS